MSSKRRYDSDRLGPARNTRSRVAQRRLAELDANLLRLIASFLPLETYAVLCHRLLPVVDWGQERRKWVLDQLDVSRLQLTELCKNHIKLVMQPPREEQILFCNTWMPLLSYLAIGTTETIYADILQWWRISNADYIVDCHWLDVVSFVRWLSRFPRSGLMILMKTERWTIHFSYPKQFILMQTMSMAPMSGFCSKPFLLPGCWQWYQNAADWLLAQGKIDALTAMLQGVVELWPNIMIRWFGPDWRVVYTTNNLETLCKQIAAVMQPCLLRPLPFGWWVDWTIETNEHSALDWWYHIQLPRRGFKPLGAGKTTGPEM